MSLGELWRRLSFFARRRDFTSDLQEEMRLHVDLRAAKNRASGMMTNEAEYAARRAFGNRTMLSEKSREAWGWSMIEEVLRNIRFAFRELRKRRAFSVVAVISLALAIAANTAVFSFVDAVIYDKLPVFEPGRLAVLRQQNHMFHMENCCFPYRFFRELRKQGTSMFDDVLALNSTDINVTEAGQTEKISGEIVSGNYFNMLGVKPVLGRLLEENDEASEGAGRVCVISYRLWQERFGGSQSVAGRRLLLNGEPFQIVGVSEPGFSGASLHDPRDILVPASVTRIFLGDARDSFGWAEIIVRLKPGVRRETAETRLNVIGRQIEKVTGPELSNGDAFLLRDGSQGVASRKEQLGRPLAILFLLVAVVLLIACLNIAALLLVRVVERTREAGVRIALGASRAKVFHQFLTETLALAVLGGAAGWVLSRELIALLLRLLGPENQGLGSQLRPRPGVYIFSLGVTLAAGIVFGVLPAWRASRVDPLRSIQGSSGNAGARMLTSRVLIAGQIALSLVLLFAAALFSGTLHNLRAIDLGFRPENLVLMHIDLSRTIYASGGAPQFYDDLLRRTRGLAVTRTASLANISVLSGSMESVSVEVPGYVSANRLLPVSYLNSVSPAYFRTLGAPLLAGRDFDQGDNSGAEIAAIVNQQFAQRFFGGDAIGKTFRYGGARKARVVGVAGNTKFRWMREEPSPVFYTPLRPGEYPGALYLQVRSRGDTARTIERLRGIMAQMDSRVPVDSLTTMDLQIDQALGRERLLSFVSTLMGLLVVGLAMVGLYGVLATSVARRTREIGIRVTLGAGRRRVVWLFLKETAAIVAGGIVVGLPLAFGCGRLAASLLYGLEPRDPVTSIVVTASLALAALAASAIPAWRAARVNAAMR